MTDGPWGLASAVVSSGANLLGGWINNQSQKAINAANLSAQDASNRTNVALAEKQMEYSNRQAAEQMRAQYEMAQNGIRWKVADALAAGLHPLYAMGGQPISFAPVSAGGLGSYNVGAAHLDAPDGLGKALAASGQDIGRAINATRTAEERATAGAMSTLQIERANLENELLRSQIAKNNQAGGNPPMAGSRTTMDGQGNAPVKVDPMEQTPTDAPGVEPAGNPDVGFAVGADGTRYPIPGKNVKERIEDTLIPELMWAFRNHLLPVFGENRSPPTEAPGRGRQWVWDQYKHGWVKEETPFNRRFRGDRHGVD